MILRAIILLLLTLTATAQYLPQSSVAVARIPAVVSGQTFLINQGFEGAGYDNSETWTEVNAGGTVDEDYATLPLEGVQCVLLVGTAATVSTASPTFADQTTAWLRFGFKKSKNPDSDWIVGILRNGTTSLSYIRVLSTGALRIDHGTANASTTDVLSNATWYYVLVKYVAGTGANGQASIEFSTTASWTGSGNKYASLTTGSSTLALNNVQIRNEDNGSLYFDGLKVSATQITN
jgi:hypothetical protein